MELPLFPLNTVLFPGMPLSLHIFEERYKKMINLCIAEKMPFGVVLISSGTEALGPLADPYTVGCTARITQVQPISQGRMNLVAVGQDRFRVLELDKESQPYLVGRVEIDNLPDPTPGTLDPLGQGLRPQVVRYLEILAKAGDVQFDPSQLPDDPMGLANLAAFLIRVEADQKQKLLESATPERFVKDVRALFRRENALLETMLRQSQEDSNNSPFSLN